MKKTLDVYLRRNLVGKLKQDERGSIFFQYSKEWLEHDEAVSLSQSLPLRSEPFDEESCRPFFEGLLPEGEIRETIAKLFHVSAKNDFALLYHIGEECAGAVMTIPEGEPWPEASRLSPATAVKESALFEKIKGLPKRPLLAGEEGIRISLAGAQRKLPVIFLPKEQPGIDGQANLDGNQYIDGEIVLPGPHHPTTHIIKPPIPDYQETVENEYFCMRLAEWINLNVAQVWIRTIKTVRVLVVKRYDRILKAGQGTFRIHQEDFCQALGRRSIQKYQNEGGPSLRDCFQLIDSVSSNPARDREALLTAVMFNFLIGNHDAHAKNFALLYHAERSALAPLYDLMSTAVYPGLAGKMAMKIGGEYRAGYVMDRHWDELATACGFNPKLVYKRLRQLAEEMIAQSAALERQLKDEANLEAPVFSAIRLMIKKRAKVIL